MKTSWRCATLLPLFLFSCAVPEKQCQVEGSNLKFCHVAVHGNACVPCPNFTVEEMTFKLLKDENEVASIEYANITSVRRETQGNSVKHNVNGDNTTQFLLYNVSKNATGLYTCTAEKIFPPPVAEIPEKPQIVVIVEDHFCVQNSPRPYPPANHLPLWVGFGVLSIYALVISCIALILRFRLKNEDMSTHDYMNMKPRTRRRKQGINHPMHLSWYDTANNMAVSKKLPSKGTPI